MGRVSCDVNGGSCFPQYTNTPQGHLILDCRDTFSPGRKAESLFEFPERHCIKASRPKPSGSPPLAFPTTPPWIQLRPLIFSPSASPDHPPSADKGRFSFPPETRFGNFPKTPHPKRRAKASKSRARKKEWTVPTLATSVENTTPTSTRSYLNLQLDASKHIQSRTQTGPSAYRPSYRLPSGPR